MWEICYPFAIFNLIADSMRKICIERLAFYNKTLTTSKLKTLKIDLKQITAQISEQR